MSPIVDQVFSIVFVFTIINSTKHIDFTDQNNIFWVRFAYAFSQFLLYAIATYVKRKIRSISDNTKLQITEKQNPFTDEPPKTVELTVMEYDLERVSEFIRQTTISICILLFMHYKWNFVQPLIIQSILPLKAAIFLPIFQIHLLGKPAEGDLTRPFKPPTNKLGEWMEQQTEQSKSQAKTQPLPTKKQD